MELSVGICFPKIIHIVLINLVCLNIRTCTAIRA